MKGVPCIWRVLPELAQRYDLPLDLPFELVGHSTVPRVYCVLLQSRPRVFAEPCIFVCTLACHQRCAKRVPRAPMH